MEKLSPNNGQPDRAAIPPFDRELADLKSANVSAEVRSRQLLTAIIALRDGDFSARLPNDWIGLDGRLAEAFNQALSHEEHISTEVADARIRGSRPSS